MKNIVSIISCAILVLIIVIAFYFLNPEYQSAFEADQQCHFDMSSLNIESVDFGCDHDLETRQWLLYKIKTSIDPAEVLKRYRY